MLPASPLSDEWVIPKGTGPKFMFKYMRQQQVKAYGTYFQALPNNVQIRNFKLLCKNHSEDNIKRAIACGCQLSEQPFSTKFIRRVLETWLSDARSNPTIQFYQNKS